MDTRWTFDDSLNGFTITSLRSINRGEQVYDSYGRKVSSAPRYMVLLWASSCDTAAGMAG